MDLMQLMNILGHNGQPQSGGDQAGLLGNGQPPQQQMQQGMPQQTPGGAPMPSQAQQQPQQNAPPQQGMPFDQKMMGAGALLSQMGQHQGGIPQMPSMLQGGGGIPMGQPSQMNPMMMLAQLKNSGLLNKGLGKGTA